MLCLYKCTRQNLIFSGTPRHNLGNVWLQGFERFLCLCEQKRVFSACIGTSSWFHVNMYIKTFFSLGGVRLSPLGTSATVVLLYQPRVMDDDYGAVGGMRIGRGNRSTLRKPAPVPLCPPQIPHDQTWDRSRPVAVGSQQLTA
jgi:hypothetical protein